MADRPEIFDLMEKFIDDHSLETTPEAMFIEFEALATMHREFEAYLSNENLTVKLNTMQRSKVLKEKRKLFIEWYILKNQNDKILKEMIYELSQMTFAATRTVEYDIFNATTARND